MVYPVCQPIQMFYFTSSNIGPTYSIKYNDGIPSYCATITYVSSPDAQTFQFQCGTQVRYYKLDFLTIVSEYTATSFNDLPYQGLTDFTILYIYHVPPYDFNNYLASHTVLQNSFLVPLVNNTWFYIYLDDQAFFDYTVTKLSCSNPVGFSEVLCFSKNVDILFSPNYNMIKTFNQSCFFQLENQCTTECFVNANSDTPYNFDQVKFIDRNTNWCTDNIYPELYYLDNNCECSFRLEKPEPKIPIFVDSQSFDPITEIVILMSYTTLMFLVALSLCIYIKFI